jgi:hypothetical protein
MTAQINARLQRLEATPADREAQESTWAVLQRLTANEAVRPLTEAELGEQIGAVVRVWGGRLPTFSQLSPSKGQPTQVVEMANDYRPTSPALAG